MGHPDLKPYWNTNVARHPGILRTVPAACRRALDVGCGDGLLAWKLADRAQHVLGVDKSPEMIAAARERAAGRTDLAFATGDFLALELPDADYDFICSVTTIQCWRARARSPSSPTTIPLPLAGDLRAHATGPA
ncbi:class I SAM-dependent methyltransferase [Streptomyces kaniharaensis]|uniref:class I SAM-dependent methyltransferase n=1 Tax=Streptomyces kaniharaensis TaxID=212423 RepID=UPI001E4A311F|nr:class I SAM-dependent methyltransferase [Streptomyces kaniharaensis]